MKKNAPPSVKRPPLAMPLRIGIFALMFLAMVVMGARIRDIVLQIAHGEAPSVFAPLKAEEAKHEPAKDAGKTDTPKAEEKKPEEKKEAAKPAEAAKPEEKKADDKPADAKPADAAPEVDDPSLDGPDLTESEINVLRHLSQRRKELDKKSYELEQRETLLNVTEQRVDKKIADLKTMQDEIKKILGEADSQHKAQVTSMVKIYETMKPKDAARIFEGMETPLLVEVLSRMKEAKAAPVLAAMDAGKAKEATTSLMNKKALPTP